MKKENQPKQRKRWKKVLLIILCIVLVLLLAGFLILRSIFMQPSIPAATGMTGRLWKRRMAKFAAA